MPSSLQPRLTTWQQNKIMESFAWDAEKEIIIYTGGIKKEDASGTYTFSLPSGGDFGGTITARYELLNSGRILLQYDFAVNIAATNTGSQVYISRAANPEYDAFCKAIEKVISKDSEATVLYGIVPVARNGSGAAFTSVSVQQFYSSGIASDMTVSFNYQMGTPESLNTGGFIQGNINSII